MKSVKAIIENQQTATVAPSTSVLDAAIMMARRGIGAVPVVEGDRLAGIFTERDVLTRVVAAGGGPAGAGGPGRGCGRRPPPHPRGPAATTLGRESTGPPRAPHPPPRGGPRSA